MVLHAKMKLEAGEDEQREEKQLHYQTSDYYFLSCVQGLEISACHYTTTLLTFSFFQSLLLNITIRGSSRLLTGTLHQKRDDVSDEEDLGQPLSRDQGMRFSVC